MGLHEKLLNNLLLRYDLGLIPDLFEYFREPWTQAIFHEKFPLLSQKNHKAFDKNINESVDVNFVESIIQKLIRNRWQSVSRNK